MVRSSMPGSMVPGSAIPGSAGVPPPAASSMAQEPTAAIQAIEKRIIEAAEAGAAAQELRALAEARAWLISTDQPH